MYSIKQHISIYLLLVVFCLIFKQTSPTFYQCSQTNSTIDAVTVIGPRGEPHNPSEKCEFKIEPVHPNTYTILEWTRFNVDDAMRECYETGVTAYIGCSNEVKVATFCSRNSGKPFPIVSRDGCIRIVATFSTNESITTSFAATYKTYSSLSRSPFGKCKTGYTNVVEESGLLASPNWPNGYDKDDRCKWYLKFPRKKYFLIYLFDVDMNVPPLIGRNVRGRCKDGWKDRLVIKFYRFYHHIKLFCGIEQPKLLELYDRRISIGMVNFNFNQSFKGRGFVLGYMKYGQVDKKKAKQPISRAPSSMGAWAILIIVVISFAACCIFCIYIYNKYRSRRKRAQEFEETSRLNTVPTTELPTQTSNTSDAEVHRMNSNNDDGPTFLEIGDRRIELPKYTPRNHTTDPASSPLLQQPLEPTTPTSDGIPPVAPLHDGAQSDSEMPHHTSYQDGSQNVERTIPTFPLHDISGSLDGEPPPLTPSYDESEDLDGVPVHPPSPVFGEAPPSYEDALRAGPV